MFIDNNFFYKGLGSDYWKEKILERVEFAVKFLDSNLEFIYNKVST